MRGILPSGTDRATCWLPNGGVTGSRVIGTASCHPLLMDELALVSRALKDETRCDKLNVAAIGNVVPQLHIHIVARRKDDAAWPKPVWGAVPRRAYEADAMERFVAAIRGRVL